MSGSLRGSCPTHLHLVQVAHTLNQLPHEELDLVEGHQPQRAGHILKRGETHKELGWGCTRSPQRGLVAVVGGMGMPATAAHCGMWAVPGWDIARIIWHVECGKLLGSADMCTA